MSNIIEISYNPSKKSIQFKYGDKIIMKEISNLKDIPYALDNIHNYDEIIEDLYVGEELKKFLTRVKRCVITSISQTKDILSVYVTNVDVMCNYIEDHQKEFITHIGLDGNFTEDNNTFIFEMFNGKAKYIYKVMILQSKKTKQKDTH